MSEQLKDFTRWLALRFGAFTLVYAIVGALMAYGNASRDDSDPGQWGKRSGVPVRTDHLTGCQYLEAVSGGLTPRLDVNGRHVGCKQRSTE